MIPIISIFSIIPFISIIPIFLMIPKLPIFLLAASLLFSCTSTTEPTPEPVVLKSATRAYDGARGGVQITSIYYDQTDNGAKVGVTDEWIVIEATGTMNTTSPERSVD